MLAGVEPGTRTRPALAVNRVFSNDQQRERAEHQSRRSAA